VRVSRLYCIVCPYFFSRSFFTLAPQLRCLSMEYEDSAAFDQHHFFLGCDNVHVRVPRYA
jgi:hypothetical protein